MTAGRLMASRDLPGTWDTPPESGGAALRPRGDSSPGGGSARRGSPDPRCPDLRREVAPLLPDLIAMGCPPHLAGDLAAVLWFFGPPAVAGAAWILARPTPVPPDRRWWNK